MHTDNFLFTVHIYSIYISYIVFSAAFFSALLYIMQDYRLKHKFSGAVFNRLPDLSALDRFNYKSIGLGFPLRSADHDKIYISGNGGIGFQGQHHNHHLREQDEVRPGQVRQVQCGRGLCL